MSRRGAFTFSGKWAERVKSLPETGMGYTVVQVTLQDGRSFEQALVGEGMLSRVRGIPDVPFIEDEIVEIVATHRKWNWKEEP